MPVATACAPIHTHPATITAADAAARTPMTAHPTTTWAAVLDVAAPEAVAAVALRHHSMVDAAVLSTARAIDGTNVDTFLGKESKEKMESMAMAAGASLAGIVLLGPIGIVAGAFVYGKNIDLPAGTELYIQTKAENTLYGIQTTVGE